MAAGEADDDEEDVDVEAEAEAEAVVKAEAVVARGEQRTEKGRLMTRRHLIRDIEHVLAMAMAK